MTNKIIKQEQGRSMVEMLGTLTIIGVLSVGSIAGYTYAMRSYRANEIVNATSMLYMSGIAQNQGAGDAEMVYSTHFGANAVPSGASEITYNANKTISVDFTDVDICNQVKVKLDDKAEGTCAASGTSTLTVTLGDVSTSTTEEEPPPLDNTVWRQEDPYQQCNPGYAVVYSPLPYGCARNLAEAISHCQLSGYSAEIVETDGGEKYFSCS